MKYQVLNMLEIIGITGGIASGKTKATRYLEKLGHTVIDCDIVYQHLLQTNAQMLLQLKNSQFFPENCFIKTQSFNSNNSNNSDSINLSLPSSAILTLKLNKATLREFLFNHENAQDNLKKLGDITHPFIFQEVMKRVQKCQEHENFHTYYEKQTKQQQTQDLKKIKKRKKLFPNKLFIAIPLLFERWNIWKNILHGVWNISVDLKVQKKRLKKRCIAQKNINSLATILKIINYQATNAQRQSIATICIDNNGDSWKMFKQLKKALN